MGTLLLASLLACGALSTPPEPLVGQPLRVESATARDLDDGVEVLLGLRSGLRREAVVDAGAFELSGVNGVLARVDWTPVGQPIPGGEQALAEWRTDYQRPPGGGLVEEAPLVLSGTLWLQAPGGGAQLVPFTVPVRLLDPETP